MTDTTVRAIYDNDSFKIVDGVQILENEAGDWVFGIGQQAYKTQVQMVAQRIATHIRSWYHDCFFDYEFGIPWRDLLGHYRTQRPTALQVRSMINKIPEIIRIKDLSLSLDEDRRLSLYYEVDTIYGVVAQKVDLLV